ncbi:hypothetical protein PCASD_11485 [Puccinia coronata f. sp. avenae]|uniref:Uncharacterized protein n=1 Tax=Puccinia coronata f. sp. avenae TaxID=200324 RepID=A0A2N5V3J7_9BASI|nr:hypothetical protein PCASD_11485 [Puccinia coronata f. sp. avenae]
MPNSTHIQTRLDLILSQVLLKLDLVIQRDQNQSVSREDAQATTTKDEGTPDAATPPFLAAIKLDHGLAQPVPREEEGASLPASIPRDHSCVPVHASPRDQPDDDDDDDDDDVAPPHFVVLGQSTAEPSAAAATNTTGTTPCPHLPPAPGPHSLPVEHLHLDDNLPSSQAPHLQDSLGPLPDNGILELEPTSCTLSTITPLPALLPRKKNKKKRKNKMRVEQDGRAAERKKRVASAEGEQGGSEGGGGRRGSSRMEYEQQQQMGHGGEAMMMMGDLVRWGDTIPSTHASSMGHHHHHPPPPAFGPSHITGHGDRSYHAGGLPTTTSYPNPAYYPYSLADVPYPHHLGFYPNYSLPDPHPPPLLPTVAPHAVSATAPAPVDHPPSAATPCDHPAL